MESLQQVHSQQYLFGKKIHWKKYVDNNFRFLFQLTQLLRYEAISSLPFNFNTEQYCRQARIISILVSILVKSNMVFITNISSYHLDEKIERTWPHIVTVRVIQN